MHSTFIILDHYNYDYILNEIGFGRYQIYIYLTFGLVAIQDSIESTINSFLIVVFKKEWDISDN